METYITRSVDGLTTDLHPFTDILAQAARSFLSVQQSSWKTVKTGKTV